MRRSCLPLLLLAACASPKPAPAPALAAMSFDEAPVVEPEAGPVAQVKVAAATAPEAAAAMPLDAGAATADALPLVAADAGRPDAGKLIEPLLKDDATKERFEKALELALDDPGAAQREFEAIAALDPAFYFAHYNAALCVLRQGDEAAGEAALQAVHDRFGSVYHGATEALAWVRFRRGDREGAEAMLKSAMNQHGRVLDLRNAYGRLMLEVGRFEEAGAVAMKTLKKDEINVGAMQVLGWSFCKRNKMELCLLVLRNALKVPGEEHNGMTSYLAALAFLKYAKGAQKLTAEARVRRAHDYLETAAAALPDRPEVLINYAQVLLDKGNSQEALKLSTRATLLRKDLMEGWIIKGVAQRDVGKYGEARLTFLTVLRNQPERREVLYNLAILFMDHALDKKTGDEVCPDVSIDDMKQEVGSDLFEGVAVKHLKPQHVDTLRRLRQATKYLEQYKEQAELDFEQLAQVEKQVRTANQAIRRETKKRSRALKKEKRAKKKAARRKKKMEKERLKRETEEAERKMEEAAAAAAGDAQGGQGNAVDATVDPAAAMPPEPAPDVPPEPAPDVPPEPVSDVPPEPASEVPVEVAPDPAPAGGTDGEEKEEEKEEEKTSDSDSKKKEKLAPQEPEAAPSAGEEGSSADVQGADDAKEEK